MSNRLVLKSVLMNFCRHKTSEEVNLVENIIIGYYWTCLKCITQRIGSALYFAKLQIKLGFLFLTLYPEQFIRLDHYSIYYSCYTN